MDVPKSFSVGLPQLFARLVGGWLSTGETAAIHGLDGEWVRVKGGPLPVPVVVRIDKSRDGRFIVTGLLIGFRDRREITWQTMRQIKPATILSLIFSGFDPNNPAKLYAETDRFSDDDSGPPIRLNDPAWREHMRAMAALELWRLTGGPVAEGAEVTEITKPRASVATNLTEFAETYVRHYAANPRGATTATATEMHISRATAIRRLAECRRLGLLPQRVSNEHE